MNMFSKLLGYFPYRMHQRKGKILNQTRLCIKTERSWGAWAPWSWDCRFALYPSHPARSVEHCPGSSFWKWEDDLRIFIGETSKAVCVCVGVFLSLTVLCLSPLPDFSVKVYLPNGSKLNRHSRNPTSWNLSRTGLLTCAFFVNCFLMQVGWGQKLFC